MIIYPNLSVVIPILTIKGKYFWIILCECQKKEKHLRESKNIILFIYLFLKFNFFNFNSM